MRKEYDLNLRDYWRILQKHSHVILLAALMAGLFSFVLAWLYRPLPIYEAVSKVKVEKSSTVTGIYLEALSWSGADFLETQQSIITSYPIMEKVARELGLIGEGADSEKPRADSRAVATILELRDKITAKRESSSNLINITAASSTPREAMDIANTVARIFTEHHTEEVNKRTSESRKFIEEQLQRVTEKLAQAEERVKRFQEEHRLLSLDTQTTALLNQIAEVEVEHEKRQDAVETISSILQRLRRFAEQPLSTRDSFYINEAPGPYTALVDKLVALLLERETLLLTYTEQHPKIKELDSQLAEITANIAASLQERLSEARRLAHESSVRLDGLHKSLELLPTDSLTLARLQREVQLNEKVFSLLDSKLQEAMIMEAAKVEEVIIVELALEPQTSKNQSRIVAKGLAGVVLGLIVGMLIALIHENLDTSFNAVKEVEEFIGARVLGSVAEIDQKELARKCQEIYGQDGATDRQAERLARLITHLLPGSATAECFRAVAANARFAGIGREMKTIAVTSSVGGEGRTTTIINTALAMAQMNHRVLLIEANLRKPAISRAFGIDPMPGLTDVVLGSFDWRRIVRDVTDIMLGEMTMEEVTGTPGMDNLHLMSFGYTPVNPAEFLASDKFGGLLKEVAREYDVVLVDLPPVLAAADASMVSALVDGVVLVYRAGTTAREALQRAREQLVHARANIAGIILNGIDSRTGLALGHSCYPVYGTESRSQESGVRSQEFCRRALRHLWSLKSLWPSKIETR